MTPPHSNKRPAILQMFHEYLALEEDLKGAWFYAANGVKEAEAFSPGNAVAALRKFGTQLAALVSGGSQAIGAGDNTPAARKLREMRDTARELGPIVQAIRPGITVEGASADFRPGRYMTEASALALAGRHRQALMDLSRRMRAALRDEATPLGTGTRDGAPFIQEASLEADHRFVNDLDTRTRAIDAEKAALRRQAEAAQGADAATPEVTPPTREPSGQGGESLV